MSYKKAQPSNTVPTWATTRKIVIIHSFTTFRGGVSIYVKSLKYPSTNDVNRKQLLITLRLGTWTIWRTVTMSAIPWGDEKKKTKTKISLNSKMINLFTYIVKWLTYEYILSDPCKLVVTIHCPKNSKDYAERQNSQGQIWNSSKEWYFDGRLCSMFEPPDNYKMHIVQKNM